MTARFDLSLPENPELAAKLVEVHAKAAELQARSDERKLEMGVMGRAFGSVRDKPGNIAGAAIIISLLMILIIFFVAYFVPNTNNVPVGELLTLFGGVVTLALGYLFGKSQSGE